jgi:hypothetical protein
MKKIILDNEALREALDVEFEDYESLMNAWSSLRDNGNNPDNYAIMRHILAQIIIHAIDDATRYLNLFVFYNPDLDDEQNKDRLKIEIDCSKLDSSTLLKQYHD